MSKKNKFLIVGLRKWIPVFAFPTVTMGNCRNRVYPFHLPLYLLRQFTRLLCQTVKLALRKIATGICHVLHQTGECGTRPFLKWVQVQDRSPDTFQKCLCPIGIPLKRCTSVRLQVKNLVPTRRVRACGDSSLRLE